MKRALLTFLFFLPLWCVAQGRSAAEYPLGDTLRYDPVPYEVDLKTNLLMDATATINLGVEFPLGRRWSMDVSGNYNGWTLSDNRKWKHWMVQPEFRFWTKTRQRGHFIGIHLLGGEYNLNRMHLPFKMYPSTAGTRAGASARASRTVTGGTSPSGGAWRASLVLDGSIPNMINSAPKSAGSA